MHQREFNQSLKNDVNGDVEVLTFTLFIVEMTMHGQRARRLRRLRLAPLVAGLRGGGRLLLSLFQVVCYLRILIQGGLS